MAAALALVGATGAAAQAGASWLDGPPRAFNSPGAAIPAAPPPVTPPVDRCRDRERAAAGPEETRVAAAGWRLEGYWPTRRSGDLALVMATADYDGMCRPAAFNGFAFVGERFAGTLAPEAMVSRLDGVLVDPPALSADRRLTASFTRYAPTARPHACDLPRRDGRGRAGARPRSDRRRPARAAHPGHRPEPAPPHRRPADVTASPGPRPARRRAAPAPARPAAVGQGLARFAAPAASLKPAPTGPVA